MKLLEISMLEHNQVNTLKGNIFHSYSASTFEDDDFFQLFPSLGYEILPWRIKCHQCRRRLFGNHMFSGDFLFASYGFVKMPINSTNGQKGLLHAIL